MADLVKVRYLKHTCCKKRGSTGWLLLKVAKQLQKRKTVKILNQVEV